MIFISQEQSEIYHDVLEDLEDSPHRDLVACCLLACMSAAIREQGLRGNAEKKAFTEAAITPQTKETLAKAIAACSHGHLKSDLTTLEDEIHRLGAVILSSTVAGGVRSDGTEFKRRYITAIRLPDEKSVFAPTIREAIEQL